MALQPFQEKGKPLSKQADPWRKVVYDPYDKDSVDEYTRLKIICAYGMENEQWYFYHAFDRHTDNEEIKAAIGQIRRAEDQHRSEASFWFDPKASNLEETIAIEHLAVDLTANSAIEEPDPYVKQVFEFGLLEDFDHLFRYSELMRKLENKDPNKIVRGLTEIKPGRPTWLEHLHPLDTLRNFYDASKADPLTKLHVQTVLAAEQQTRQYYTSHGWKFAEREARELYAEIGEIEEQHVTQYECLIDPRPSWLQMALDHEYNEVYNYASSLATEKDPRVKKMWEEHLSEELDHLAVINALLKKYEKMEGSQLWPETLPKLFVFQPQVDYINEVLSTQVDLRANGTGFAPKQELPRDWPSYQYQDQIDFSHAPSTRYAMIEEMAGTRAMNP